MKLLLMDAFYIFRLLKKIDFNATVTCGNNTRSNHVHIVVGHGHLEEILLIIKKHGGSINLHTRAREAPLHYVMNNNHLASTSLLLKHGANRYVNCLRYKKSIQLL